MIVYEDQNISIELVKPNNILCVRWAETDIFTMDEFELTFEILIKMIEKYGSTKILLYASKTSINLPDDIYSSIIALLHSGFQHSKIEKVARIFYDRSKKDLQRLIDFRKIMKDMEVSIEFRNFQDKESALTWLSFDRNS